MYFNHAFRKGFLPKVSGGAVSIIAAGNGTQDLLPAGAGTLGIFDAKTNVSLDPAPVSVPATPFYIAQASYYTSDKITPFLGGYQESVKSKVINPRYVSRVIKYVGAAPTNQIKDIKVCNLECGKNYNLRMDLKGSPALRFLSHNIYKTLSAYTGCCTDDCTATCTGALVDPTTVAINWAKQIVNDPILSNYMTLSVTDYEDTLVATQASTSAADIAAFILALDAYSPTTPWDPTAPGAPTAQGTIRATVAYVDTKFGACTFTPTDFYEIQPLNMLFSLTDESGDPCNVQCFEVSGQYAADGSIPLPYGGGTQPGSQAEGLVEGVVRELILDGRYRQEYYPDSMRVDDLRKREIEANPSILSLSALPRTAIYDRVIVLHSVPRFNNPTGTFDNDQYMLVFHVPTGTTTTALTDYIVDACAAAGNSAVTLETY